MTVAPELSVRSNERSGWGLLRADALAVTSSPILRVPQEPLARDRLEVIRRADRSGLVLVLPDSLGSLVIFGFEFGSANGDRTRTLSLERAAC